MKKHVDQIQENARMIDQIADNLIEDHVEMMLENRTLVEANEKLQDIIFELLDEHYPRSCWSDEHIEYEMEQGNMAAPMVKRAYDAIRARGKQ